MVTSTPVSLSDVDPSNLFLGFKTQVPERVFCKRTIVKLRLTVLSEMFSNGPTPMFVPVLVSPPEQRPEIEVHLVGVPQFMRPRHPKLPTTGVVLPYITIVDKDQDGAEDQNNCILDVIDRGEGAVYPTLALTALKDCEPTNSTLRLPSVGRPKGRKERVIFEDQSVKDAQIEPCDKHGVYTIPDFVVTASDTIRSHVNGWWCYKYRFFVVMKIGDQRLGALSPFFTCAVTASEMDRRTKFDISYEKEMRIGTKRPHSNEEDDDSSSAKRQKQSQTTIIDGVEIPEDYNTLLTEFVELSKYKQSCICGGSAAALASLLPSQ